MFPPKSSVHDFTEQFLPSNFPVRCTSTSKSFSEALILASTNPQYDKRFFHGITMKTIPDSSFHSLFMKFLQFTIDGAEFRVEVPLFCRNKKNQKIQMFTTP